MKPFLSATIAFTLALPLGSSSSAQDKAASDPLPPQEREKAAAYVIPAPGDIFDRLNNVPIAQWQNLAAAISKQDFSGATREGAPKTAKAIALGVRVADAFVALEAEDTKLLRQLKDVIEKLGADLNVSAPINARANELRRLVEEKKWVAAGSALADMRGAVIQEFEKSDNRDFYTLASLGGWIRGLEVVSRVLAEHYDPAATKVLRDPGLLAHLRKQAESLSPEAKADPFVRSFLERADALHRLVNFPKDGTLPQAEVAALAENAKQIVSSARL